MSTPLNRLKKSSMLKGFDFWLTSRTISPRCRSCSPTAALESASSCPLVVDPARSIALNSKVVADISSGPVQPGHRRCHGGRPTQQSAELLRHRGPLFGQLAADLAATDEPRQVSIHRLHADRAGGLHGGVDLMRFPLADQ